MPEIDFFSLFTDRFNALSVEYMVTGSAVIVAYGEPRLTNDIDLVLTLTAQQVADVIGAFSSSAYYCPPEEVLNIEIGRTTRGHFNIVHYETGLKADCYLSGTDPFQAWGLGHRKQLSLSGHTVFFAPLEYVIVKKLQFYEEGRSEKHLRDIRSLLLVSGDLVEYPMLERYIREFNLASSWQAVMSTSVDL